MAYFPLFLNSTQPVLIIGGGVIAAAKAEALASVDASITLIGRDVAPATRALCDQHNISWREAEYSSDMLHGQRIVVAATDDAALNARIAEEAKLQNILVNVVDAPELCDFIFPALVRRGALQIAISTSGISPVLARMIKQTIERVVPDRFVELIEFLQRTRTRVRTALPGVQARRLFLEQLTTGAIAEEVLEGNHHRAEHLLELALHEAPTTKQPALYLVGAGCGNPELITLKAIRLLGQADVILYDRLTSPELLTRYARKDAQKILVGKTRHHHHATQQDIDSMLEEYLAQGNIVVRLKGGDPSIFGHAAEEASVAVRMGVPFQIIPGITAASGCAAYAGIPLTERGGASSVRMLTLYKDQLNDTQFWQNLAHAHHETLVFYMSSTHYSTVCQRLRLLGYADDTPLLITEQGTTEHQRTITATIGTFEALYGGQSFASPNLLIVGNVVRWHHTQRWKQDADTNAAYFPALPGKPAPSSPPYVEAGHA